MAEAKPAPCQVRNKTGNPCPRRAEVKILGVAFCGPCTREQEAYFAIGELKGKEGQRQERAGSTDGIAATMSHGLSGVDETKPLAFRKS